MDAVAPGDCEVVTPGPGRSMMGKVAQAALSEDPLVVYWSGHATVTADGQLYLATPDSDARTLATWLSAHSVAEKMMSPRGPADRLLILDACFSFPRSAHRSEFPDRLRRGLSRLARRGIAVLSSVSTTPTAFAANTRTPSVFTGQLATVLRTGARTATNGLSLASVHRLLGNRLSRNGYYRACLRNAAGYTTPITSGGPHTPRPAPAALPAHPSQDTQRYALAVGGSPAPSGPANSAFAQVRPADDARTFHAALLHGGCGFTSRSTSLLAGVPSLGTVRNSIRNLAGRSSNMLLVYVSALGVVDSGPDGLDIQLTLAPDARIATSELVKELRSSTADRVMLLVDVCTDDAAERPSGGSGHDRGFPPWQRRAGFSQVVVSWGDSVVRSPTMFGSSALTPPPLPWYDGIPTRSALTRPDLPLPDPSAPGDLVATPPFPPSWRFDFPGAQVHTVDRAGPLAAWGGLLGMAPSVVTDDAHFPLNWACQPPVEMIQPPARAPEKPGRHAARPIPAVAAPAEETAPAHRGHRARLRLADDALPVRAGSDVVLTFDYVPLDHAPRVPRPSSDATEEHPLDITVRIRATSATVYPSLVHLPLTDERGTPPQDFTVTPRSDEPVELSIDVLRRADGALLQELKAVLPARDTEDLELSR
ncbi:hypothetical protein J7E86_02445 [Streptomyces sp. ISL-11]|nr:hypothetical protein [Streptomyces sp. ISL-11]